MVDKTRKIILAEDNPGDVFLVRRALNQHLAKGENSFTLLLAKDGEEAIRILEQAEEGQDPIDLMLIDLNLPRRDGGEVLNRLRKMHHLAGIPVIVMTSSDSPHDRKRCMELGANRYFQKPTELNRFMEIGRIVADLIDGN
jgi:CheY-like chemotaxis protein